MIKIEWRVESWVKEENRWAVLRHFKTEKGAIRMVARNAMMGLVNRVVAISQ